MYCQSWQGSDPLNKHFLHERGKKMNKMLEIFKKEMGVDAVNYPVEMEEYNLNVITCSITFISAVLQPIYK